MFCSRVERRMGFVPEAILSPISSAVSLDAYAVDLETELSRAHRADADDLDPFQVDAAQFLQWHAHLVPLGAGDESIHRGYGIDARSHDHHHVAPAVAAR